MDDGNFLMLIYAEKWSLFGPVTSLFGTKTGFELVCTKICYYNSEMS